jgi:hypothetical protein
VSTLVIRGRIRKENGRWCVSILANGKVLQHGEGGWPTWEAAFRCADSSVRAWRNDRARRGLT